MIPRNDLWEVPIYGALDAAHYLRVPYQTLRYWVRGRHNVAPIVTPAATDPPRLSFMNLLECHMLSAMRSEYDLRLPKVRRALRTLSSMGNTKHPLLEKAFETNRIDLFVREADELTNLSRPKHGQREFAEFLEMHMERIETNNGSFRFFPFIERRVRDEPRSIMISPTVSFGRPVIAGTGIPTAVIASRFHARDSVGDLAREYGRSDKEIEEAIRWESRATAAAA